VLRGITFDFWNTLMWEEPGSLRAQRLVVWSEALASAGIAVDREALERAHDAAHREYERSWQAATQFRVEDAADLILERMRGVLPSEARDVLIVGFSQAGRRAAIHPSEGVRECLEALSAANIRLGIVCDIGLTPSPVVRELLDRHDLLTFFDGMSFSDEVGAYKPAPAIFEHALETLGGVPADEAAHVGDRHRTDVTGAISCGWTAVRYNGAYEDASDGERDADFVTAHLADLAELLGVRVTSR
jgi:FMN phosphatase YigB (HAD superfamily)